MPVATGDISNVTRFPVGNSKYLIFFKYTGPSSYTAAGEYLTRTVSQSALGGITNLDFLIITAPSTSSYTTAQRCAYEPVNDSTNVGRFHFYNSVDGHTHDLKAIGGLSSSEPLFLDASQKFGKNAATDRTIVGSTSATTGGVVATADDTSDAEVTAGANLSTFSCWCVGFGN